MTITSLQNNRVKDWVKLKDKKYRDVSDVLLIEGEHLIQEASDAGLILETIGLEDADIMITAPISQKLSSTKSGSSRFALIKKPHSDVTIGSRILVLDGVQDPGNVGTCIRSAYSFGFDAVYLSLDCADMYSDKTIRSSQGAIFHIPCIRQDLNDSYRMLHEADVQILATHVSDDSLTLDAFKPVGKLAVVMGSEGQGVSQTTLDHMDASLHIKTSNFESLNVAVACGIIAYALKQG